MLTSATIDWWLVNCLGRAGREVSRASMMRTAHDESIRNNSFETAKDRRTG